MRLARIAKLSAALAVLATVAIGALPTVHWVNAELRSRAERPDPVLATPKETLAILGAVLEHKKFAGAPPPPPEPGEPPRPEPERILILTDQSLCFGNIPTPRCESWLTEHLLIPELEPLAPRKFRAELLAANQAPRQLNLSGISGAKMVRASEIQQIFASGWWDDFHKKYPGSSGYVRISQPVLTKDRQQALIYVAHHCGGLCGAGTIHLLVRSGSSWRIVKEEMLWIS